MPENAHLSYLGFRLIAPPPILRPYVQSFWVVRTGSRLTAPSEEFLHPGGGFGLVFNRGDALRLDGQPLQPRLFLDGINTTSSKMGFEGRVDAFGVRFHAGGAFPFMQIPLHEMANTVLPIADLDPDIHTPLADVLDATQSLKGLTHWLIHRLSEHQPSLIVRESLRRIRLHHGQIAVSHLAESLHISQRQLERLYQTYVGITPKQYARLQRIARARDALKSAEPPAQIAAALGFYDQAHFINEFKSVVGLTPTQYAARRKENF